MTRCQYLILAILSKEEADSGLSAMAMSEIAAYDENFMWKENTIYKNLQSMLQKEWVKKGLRASKADTYFITDLGKKTKEEME